MSTNESSGTTNFGFGEDEALVRDTARRFLDEHAGIDKLRRLVASDAHAAYEAKTPPAGWDRGAWERIVELGWTALAVPAEAGGLATGLPGVVALVEEAGRHAFPSPLLATLLATYPLREARTAGARAWLERIAAGESATLAITGADGSWSVEDTDVTVRRDGTGAILSGTAFFVQDARKASWFIVSARDAAGVGLYAVPAETPGVTIRPDRILDLTRDQARVELHDVRVPEDGVLAPSPEGAGALRRAWPALLTLVSADIAGAAEWQLQTTAAYARIRKQFDRPIGFFQAVKHPIVDVMIAIDETRSLLYDAASAFEDELARAEVAARMAKASASETAAFASNRSLQLHGGIAMTWEADLHIYFKRQLHSQFLFGDGRHHRRELARLLWP